MIGPRAAIAILPGFAGDATEPGTSWEQIGERLGEGVSRQAATKRFGQRVDELELDVLLPARVTATNG